MIAFNDLKICENHCPNCGTDTNNIVWEGRDARDGVPCQRGICEKCGCEFSEVYIYRATIYNKKEQK